MAEACEEECRVSRCEGMGRGEVQLVEVECVGRGAWTWGEEVGVMEMVCNGWMNEGRVQDAGA